MAQQHPVRLVEQSPLSLLVCSSCQRPFSSPNSPAFRLAPCTHALCDTCVPTGTTSQPPACPVCAHPGSFAPLDHALNDPDLASFFQPLSSLLSHVESAAEWQLGNLASQLEHQRGKAKMQNRLLKKAAVEMKHLRGVKDKFAYNPSARSAPRPSGSTTTTPRPRPASSTQQQQQQQQAPLSLSRSASRFNPYPHPSPRLSTSFPDPKDGGWHGDNALAFAAPQDGFESAAGGGGEGGEAGGGEENPFRFNPPGLSLDGGGGGGGGGHGGGGYGYSSSVADLGGFELGEAEGSMPPPPVPSSSRRGTGQQARQGFVSARTVQEQQQQADGQGFFAGGGGAGTPRLQTGSFTPRPTSTSAAPFFPSSQLHPTSRQPFEPPHQHQHPQQYQQQTMQQLQAQTPAPARTGTANSHRTPFRPGGGR
ncbi:hypothetical protein JCM8097_005847 [Rhodosporidiobolus ruineniae]